MNRGTIHIAVQPRTRIVTIFVVLAVLAGISVSLSRSAQGATVPPQPLHADWDHAAVLPSGQPHSEPAHLLPTAGPHISGTTQTAESTNWSGYIATDSQFTGVSAQWVVPTVQPSRASQSSSTWVGIDGVSNTSLIQAGTEQDTSGGTTTYYAWYELLPALSIPVEYVSPGDEMKVSIVEDSPGTWTIVIADLTSGQTVSESVAYSTPQTSAEWVEEAPTSATGHLLTLADFGTAQFTNLTMSGSNLSSGVLFPVDMVDANGNTISSPGEISDDSFSVAYDGQAQVGSSAPAPVQTTSGHGYWLVGSDGGIFTFGSAQFYGSTGALNLQRPVVGMTPTGNRDGYWLVASDGGLFSFGNASYFGSIPGLGIAPAGTSGTAKRLNAPVVGMVPSSDDGGYFMVASDGGVFAFGDAKFEGSCPGIGGCSGPAVAVVPDAGGNGYWLVTATGHVYTFGDASYYGSPGQQSTAVTSAVRTADGKGYWILLANGTVDAYGDATDMGAPVGKAGGLNPASAIFATSDGGGYWVSTAFGGVYNYGDAPNDGNMAGKQLNGAIIAATGF
jgi:Peptidase A4 family